MSAFQPIGAEPLKTVPARLDRMFEEQLKAISYFERFSPDDAKAWLDEGQAPIERWVGEQLEAGKLNRPHIRRFWVLAVVGALALRANGHAIIKEA